jgi:hypothetical protein
LAAAITYLDLLGKRAESDSLLQRLIAAQAADGSWKGVIGPDGHPVVSPVWHTAQVVLVLARSDRTVHRERIKNAIDWLRSTQDQSGSWPGVQQYLIYFTSYAILALLQAETRERQAVERAVHYLKSRMGTDGKCSDLGGTLMCAIALREVVGDQFEHELTLMHYLLARNSVFRAEAAEGALQKCKEEQSVLVERVQFYEEKYKDADLVITKKQLLVIILVSLFITTLGTVAGVFALLATGLKP